MKFVINLLCFYYLHLRKLFFLIVLCLFISSCVPKRDITFDLSSSSDYLVTLDTTPPTVTINKAISETVGSCSFISATAPVRYRITFSEAINPASFTSSDITNSGTGGATALSWTLVSCGDNINFKLMATILTGDGTIIPNISSNAITDVAGNFNATSQSGASTSAFTYLVAPSLSGVSLNAGPLAGFANVTINGSDFVTGANVTFGGTACLLPIVVSSTQITCTTPAHAAGAVTVVVTNNDFQFGTATSAYTYQAAPTVSSVAFNSGALAGGTAVTITGTGFVTGLAASFGGIPCSTPNFVSSTSMTCVTPADAAGLVAVEVTNADTQSGSAQAYTYQAAPAIATISPASGPLLGGSVVTISGTGFQSGTSVYIGGSSFTTVSIINSTSLTCILPFHTAGVVAVTVTNADSQTVNKAGETHLNLKQF